jgi:(p)ppGpp synthase/HD superfamily hydrolase
MTTTHQTENRESFFARLRPIMAPSELLRVEVAYALSKHTHRHQERKEMDSSGNPIRYFEHLRGTTLNAIDELGINDPDIIIACLMHDSIEDTADIHPAMLEHLFGAHVAQMVTLLTKAPGEKETYFRRLSNYADAATMIVKGCDRLHNLRSMKDCEIKFIEKQITETEEWVIPLIKSKDNVVRNGFRIAASYGGHSPIMVLVHRLENEVTNLRHDHREALEKLRRENVSAINSQLSSLF